jgi:stringent starvation protein B
MFKNFNAPMFLALREFMENNGMKPHMAVGVKGITNPVIASYARNGVVYLNVSFRACKLHVSDNGIDFEARFGGQLQSDFLPWEDIQYVADANGIAKDAYVFTTDHAFDLRGEEEASTPTVAPVARPKFGVVQGGKE